jgi:hypothetical protein
MRTDRSCVRLACALAVFVACCAASSSALAHHTEKEHLTDDTAWTMASDKAWRIGLFKAAVGLGDNVIVGTYTWPWLALTPNAYLKWRFYGGDAWHWAVQLGFFHLNTGNFFPDAKKPPILNVVSASALQSVRLAEHHQLSNSLVLTAVRIKGEVDNINLRGAGDLGLSSLQYVAAYEWRWSRRTAFVLTARYLIAQVADAKARATLNPDEFTTIDVYGNAIDEGDLNYRGALALMPAFAFSWQTFNLELGVSIGNPNIPGVNLMPNARLLIPTLDLYWTF